MKGGISNWVKQQEEKEMVVVHIRIAIKVELLK